MKILITAAAALALSGSALAYQTGVTTTTEVDNAVEPTIRFDPMIAIAPPASWTAEQRTLWEQHLATYPVDWTEDERADFATLIAIPPANWTPEQRALYVEHHAHLPASWTAAQRAAYHHQMAHLATPWVVVTQTAATDVVHSGPDLSTFAGMGGPYEEVYGDGSVSLAPRPADQNYPPCDPGPGDDNCIQLYEPGVRAQLASWDRPTGGFAGEGMTGMGGPIEASNDDSDDVDAIVPVNDPTPDTTLDTIPDTMVDDPIDEYPLTTGSGASTDPDPAGNAQDEMTRPD